MLDRAVRAASSACAPHADLLDDTQPIHSQTRIILKPP